MSDSTLILAPPAPIEKIKLNPEGAQMLERALAGAALIGKVTNADENAIAARAQADLKSIVSSLEKAGKEIRDPHTKFCKDVIAFVEETTKEAVQELERVSNTIASFHQLEIAKQRAIENAANESLTALEREREAALANATSHDQRDAIQEHYSEKAAELSKPVIEPVRAEGQRISTDWEITRINEHQLAKARPDLVRKFEFDMRAVKAELARGVKLPGVEAREVVKAGVSGTGKVVNV